MKLFEEKKDCCGCGVCSLICPKNAITMKEDLHGFVYPVISDNDCINCGKCKNFCAYQKKKKAELIEPIEVYASSRKNENLKLFSASGGLFAVAAEYVLKNGGIVYGVSMQFATYEAQVEHCRISDVKNLKRILGSKYVHSYGWNTFADIKSDLEQGLTVLFSGTPCQIDALKQYLRREYDNLLTIDIVCHGVGSRKMFNDYIKGLCTTYNCMPKDFVFRNKFYGWGHSGSKFLGQDGEKIVEKKIQKNDCSYYSMYLDCEILRENCFHCKYTNISRVGDITLGDYWGIEKVHPECLTQNGGQLDKNSGISVVIINTVKGKALFEAISDDCYSVVTTTDEAVKYNDKLSKPSCVGKYRNEILKKYEKKGFNCCQKFYFKKQKRRQYIERAKSLVRRIIKRSL